MRKLLIGLVLALGCSGEKPPAFVDEAQEARYLGSLSNPTPEQFKRREDLQAKAEQARLVQEKADQARIDEEEARTAPRRNAIKVAEFRAGDDLMAAKRMEDAGDYNVSLSHWRKVEQALADYPESMTYQQAVNAINRVEPLAKPFDEMAFHESEVSKDVKSAIRMEDAGNYNLSLGHWRKVNEALKAYPESKVYKDAEAAIIRVERLAKP